MLSSVKNPDDSSYPLKFFTPSKPLESIEKADVKIKKKLEI